MANLKDLFLDELADMYDAENRISKALPKMAQAATVFDLKDGLRHHYQETLGQIKKLKKVFTLFGKKAKGRKCQATVGLLKEGEEILEDNQGEPTLNSGIVAACRKVEHYEIALYSSLIEWAKLLNCSPAVQLLEEILEEEQAANDTLIDLAQSTNREALEVRGRSGKKSRARRKAIQR
jgi:ferritin-like metal-binding protein YciE